MECDFCFRILFNFTSAVHQIKKRKSPQRTSMKMKKKRRRTRLLERCCHVVNSDFVVVADVKEVHSFLLLWDWMTHLCLAFRSVCLSRGRTTGNWCPSFNLLYPITSYFCLFLFVQASAIDWCLLTLGIKVTTHKYILITPKKEKCVKYKLYLENISLQIKASHFSWVIKKYLDQW